MTTHKFGGMDKDTPFAQRSQDLYWDAHNIKLVNNGANKSVTKHEGFDPYFSIPDIDEMFNQKTGTLYVSYTEPLTNTVKVIPIYNTNNRAGINVHKNLKIVGSAELDGTIALLAVSDGGMTFVFTYYDVDEDDERYGLQLHFANYLNMTNDRKVEVISNYENLEIKKLYWADGINQLRHLNLANAELSEAAPNLIDLVTPILFTEPTLDSISVGAGQKGGKVQYAYSLYNLSGAETRISPLSKLISIVDPETGHGGGMGLPVLDPPESSLEGEILVKASMEISINKLDTSFDFIRVYAIKYTDVNEIPSIRMIIDAKITTYEKYSFVDDGSKGIIEDITVEELLSKGGTIITPYTMETKGNKLFLANYARESLSIKFDARAYKYPVGRSETYIYTDHLKTKKEEINPKTIVDDDHACYNEDEYFNYQVKSSNFGASGKFVNLNVKLEPLVRQVVDGTIDSPVFSSDPVHKSIRTWDASANMLHEEDGTEVHALSPSTAANELEGTAYLITASGTQDINATGTAIDYIKDQWIEVIYSSEVTEDDTITYSQTVIDSVTNYKDEYVERSFKRGENYRFGIEFYNNVGERSDVKWICDYRFPYTTDLSETYTVSASLTEAGIEKLTSNELVKFRLLMVERDNKNKSIISQGIVNPMMRAYGIKGEKQCYRDWGLKWRFVPRTQATLSDFMPYYTHKDYTKSIGARLGVHYDNEYDYNDIESYSEWCGVSGDIANSRVGRGPKADYSLINFFSPEILFGENFNSTTTFRILGTAVLDSERSATHRQNADLILPSASRVITKGIAFPKNVYMQESTSSDKDGTDGRFYGFNKVYKDLIIPKSRVYGNDSTINSNSKPKKYLDYSDIELSIPPSIVDSGLSKSVNGKPVTADGYIKGFVAGGWRQGTHGKMSLRTTFNTFAVLSFDDDNWSRGGSSFQFHKFSKRDPTSERQLLIGELILKLDNQYGGHTHATRQRNVYQPIGKLSDIGSTKVESKGDGDVWITKFRMLRNTTNTGNDIAVKENYCDEWLSVTIESALDLKTRYDYYDKDFDDIYLANGVQLSPTDAHSTGEIRNKIPEMQLYNDAYHMNDKILLNVAKPDSFRDQNRFPTTILASKTKINNEKVDSWLLFDTINTMTLPTKYGEIRSLNLTKDELISFQRSAVSFISVDPRVQAVAQDGLSIGLGVGKALNDYKYVTTSSGCINKWSIFDTKDATFYFDYDNRSITMLSQPEREVSVTTGINTELWEYVDKNKQLGLNTDTIGNEIIGFYDNRSENSYFTFNGKEKLTVSYNNLLNVMVSYHDFDANNYINYKGEFLKVNDQYVHKLAFDTYGDKVDMRVTILNTEASQLIKRYDNIEIDNDISFDTLQATNSYQDTGAVPFTGKHSVLRKRMVLPRASKRKRLRDDHLFLELSYKGNEAINFEYLSLTYNIDKLYYVDG